MIDRYRKSLADQVFVLLILLMIGGAGIWAILSWDTSSEPFVEIIEAPPPAFKTFEIVDEEGITCVRITEGEKLYWECLR